jgi:hydrogenase maturation protease
MTLDPAKCLILACGNALREDDGVGPWIAAWASGRFQRDARLRVESRQQWTPELAEEISQVDAAIFVDCSATSPPGSIRIEPVLAADRIPNSLSHHLDAADLLAMARDYYNSVPRASLLLTVGAGSLELREGFSGIVEAAFPAACKRLEETVQQLLDAAEAHCA